MIDIRDSAQDGSQLVELYAAILHATLAAPRVPSVRDIQSIGSTWGNGPRDFREVVSMTFSIDTNDVLLTSSVRPLDRAYAIGSSQWILEGRNDLEEMTKLNPRGAAFSVDGYTLSGAFGHRLRSNTGDQIQAIIELLTSDPSSRRAIGFIGDATDVLRVTRDFPCAASIQFLIRAGRLTMVVNMRSQSLFGVFPYDLVNFRYIQRYVAWRLGLPPGPSHFSCASAHVYEEEVDRVELFLRDAYGFSDPGELDWDAFTTR